MPRMRILSGPAQDAFDRPPKLDFAERKSAFDLPLRLLEQAKALRSPTGQIGFVLQCAYFKQSKQFYLPTDYESRDIAAAAKICGLQAEDFKAVDYAKASRLRHQQIILNFYGFRSFGVEAVKAIETEIETMARQHLKPRLIFDRCVDFLVQQKFQLPTAYRLVELIRVGLQARKSELVTRMESQLDDNIRTLLDGLFTTAEETSRYRLTLLKRISQSTRPTQIKETVADFETISELFEKLEPAMDALALGPAGIRYFAQGVMKAEIFQIHRRADADRYVHATAFISHQLYRLGDTLVDQLLSAMASFQTSVTRQHKERLFEQRREQTARLRRVVDGLDQSVFAFRQNVQAYANDNALTDAQKIQQIKDLLSQTAPPNIDQLKADLADGGDERQYYDLLEKQSLRLQNRISPILRTLHFETSERARPLVEAIAQFKDGDATPRLDFLTEQERSALVRESGTFRLSLYKVFLFQHVTSAIKAGNLNLRRSYKYRPMDSYLIDADRWEQQRDQLLERAGLMEFADPVPLLTSLKEALDQQYQQTNSQAATNPHLRFRSDGQFVLETPASEEELEMGHSLFPQRHDVPLAQILEVINSTSGMFAAFEHWQQTYGHADVSRPALLAGIIGLGCGIGVRKMARISSSVTESELEHCVNWRFSLENIRAANDKVLHVMDALDLPKIYQSGEQLHTASDGQKFEVRGDALHASRSFKYFGQGQGVSAYTFIDERHRLWHSLVISAADRESAYVIDGLMHNDVVKSDLHSTDTHGYTEAIFGLTYLLGFAFGPRIKGLSKQSRYHFHGFDRDERKGWKIGPDKYINEALITENWDQLLRLVATIKLKENTASDIFRRLNSYSRQHALYQTTKAFGQIIKSLFILRYVADVTLRQAIERQLNKVELANRFTRAVAVGSPREFIHTTKEEQEIAEACNRLIKNSIICWNTLYLTRKLEQTTEQEAKEQLLAAIKAHSLISWAHINMLGQYDFSEETLKDSVGILPLKRAA